jgi:hydrogenase maturation protease
MAVLVAGIGNLFLGDDAFGVEVLRRLSQRPLPKDVHAVDFGIRGVDLAYALLESWDAAILVDATPRGGEPGTLYVVEPATGGPPSIEAHAMDPVRVLSFARELGQVPPILRVVGCEPVSVEEGIGLSPPVEAAVEPAIAKIEQLLSELRHA